MELPGLPEHGDIADFIEERDSRTDEEIKGEVESLAAAASEAPSEPTLAASVTPEPATCLRMRTDLGNAERLRDAHGVDLRHTTAHGWLTWDGRQWAPDATSEVMRRAAATARAIYGEAERCDSATDRAEMGKHAAKSESADKLRAMVSLAATLGGIAVRAGSFDADPWALNCANGTLDLRSGELRQHRREDLLTKLAPVRYDASATCPQFLAFLDRIFGGDGELVGFAQRAFGAAMAGVVRDHVLHMLYGTGANGKSTLLELMRYVFGDYARAAPPHLLIARRGEQHPTELATLHGARLVTSVETGERQSLDEERVKQLAGGDTISARHMRQDFFEFAPTHTLMMATNHKPRVRGTDNGIWRRIRLWPFEVAIPDDEQDPGLLDKLKAEASGILTWLVRGCAAWRAAGERIDAPACVQAVTTEYRSASDTLGAWLSERCMEDREAVSVPGSLYADYERWCRSAGERRGSKRLLGLQLMERGYARERRNSQTYYVGVRLVDA